MNAVAMELGFTLGRETTTAIFIVRHLATCKPVRTNRLTITNKLLPNLSLAVHFNKFNMILSILKGSFMELFL